MRFLLILFILNWFGAASQQLNPPNVPQPKLRLDTLNSDLIIDFIHCDAAFPGGTVELKKHVKNYLNLFDWTDDVASKRGYVSFTVEVDGTLNDIAILRGINPELDDLMLRMVEEMPNWDPACDQYGPVRSRCRLPITFNKPQ